MGRKRRSGNRHGAARSVRRPSLMGTVRLIEHGAVVETAEGSFRITSRGLREVMNGDAVAVSLGRGPRGERRAVVESVVERASSIVVGTFDEAGPLGVVRPLDTRLKADFFVLPSDPSPRRLNVSPGDVVAARIESYPTRYESGVVSIERRLGGPDAPDLGIRCIMARYDLSDGYPERAERAAATLELDVASALADPLRRDLRDRFALTIDPVDARDFDDALSIERTAGGGFLLGVHIADVSHYVAWDDPVDIEARRRGTSVYLADRVLPMLPERLSCDLCSLAPGADRLAFTVDVRLDGAGRVRSARAYPSVIRSRVRLSYAQADALLEDGAAADAPGLPDVPAGGAALAEDVRAARACGVDLAAFLRTAADLAELRRAIRARRGAVDFDTVEVHAVLGEQGEVVTLTGRERTPATGLVEEAMLIANECVAERLVSAGAATAFRVHEPPQPDHLGDAAFALLDLGVCDRDQAAAIAAGDQAAMRSVLERAAGTGAAEVANALLLRAMQRAVYRPHNLGHYALGADAYCHFTSPIRRYPDLLVHRALKMELARERLGARAARERAPRLVGSGQSGLEALLPQICRDASDAERAADAAARASQKVEVARYYLPRIGERIGGTVAWMDEMGLFVRLDGTHAEELVPMRDIGDEWFSFDARLLTVTGAETGRVVRLGDRVIVEIARANPVRGHLDLKLVHGRH